MKPATPAVRMQREVILTLNNIGFIAWVNKSGGVYDPVKKVFRTNNTGLKGVSDILGIRVRDGKFLAVELKASKSDRLTDEQKDFILRIADSNGLSCYVRDMDMLFKFLFFNSKPEFYRLDQFTVKRISDLLTPPCPPKIVNNKIIIK